MLKTFPCGTLLTRAGSGQSVVLGIDSRAINLLDRKGQILIRYMFDRAEDLTELTLAWLRYRDYFEGESNAIIPMVNCVAYQEFPSAVSINAILWTIDGNLAQISLRLPVSNNILVTALLDLEVLDQVAIHWLTAQGILEVA